MAREGSAGSLAAGYASPRIGVVKPNNLIFLYPITLGISSISYLDREIR